MGVSVRQQPTDNEWYVFIRHNGKRASYKCVDEAHALETQKAISTSIAAGQFNIEAFQKAKAPDAQAHPITKPVAVSTPTLKDYYDRVLAPRFGALARNTWKSYDASFRIHILPSLGDLPLSEIDRDHVKDLIATLRKKDAHTTSTDPNAVPRKLAKETIKNVIAALRAGFAEAMESKLIVANPAVRVGKFFKEAKDYREEIDPFTHSEVSLLLATMLKHYGHEAYTLLLLFFHTGVRAGEAVGLQWSDLDVRNQVLLVRRQYSRGYKGKPKTRKSRSVDVSTTLMTELLKLKKQRQAEFLAKGKNQIPDSIFLGAGRLIWKDGKPAGHSERQRLNIDNWRNRIYWIACDKAQIRRRRLHDTRHTFASLLLSNRESLKYVSAQLGHASIKLTADTYGHLEVGSNRSAMDQLPTLESANG